MARPPVPAAVTTSRLGSLNVAFPLTHVPANPSVDPAVIDRDRRSAPLDGIGGFLSLRTQRAEQIARALRARGVWTDYRAESLRLGPAPYLSDEQLRGALTAIAATVGALA